MSQKSKIFPPDSPLYEDIHSYNSAIEVRILNIALVPFVYWWCKNNNEHSWDIIAKENAIHITFQKVVDAHRLQNATLQLLFNNEYKEWLDEWYTVLWAKCWKPDDLSWLPTGFEDVKGVAINIEKSSSSYISSRSNYSLKSILSYCDETFDKWSWGIRPTANPATVVIEFKDRINAHLVSLTHLQASL